MRERTVPCSSEQGGIWMHPNTARRRVLLLILPCLAAAAFAAAGLWQPFHPFDIPLLFVNFLCLLCIAPELARAFTEGENRWKACGFIASAAIGAIAGLLNIAGDAAGGAFRFGALSVESWLWLGLFLLSVVSLAVVLVRMLLWDQQQWEQHRLWRQNARNERKEQRRAQRSAARDRNEEARREKQQRKLARIAAARARIAERLGLFREKITGKRELFREWLAARRARRSAAEDRREEVKRAKQRRKLERIGSGESVWADAKGWFVALLKVLTVLTVLGAGLVLFSACMGYNLIPWLNLVGSRIDSIANVVKTPYIVWLKLIFLIGMTICLTIGLCKVIILAIDKLTKNNTNGGGKVTNDEAEEERRRINILAICIVLAIAFLFFVTPINSTLNNALQTWVRNASKLAERFNFIGLEGSNSKTGKENFLYPFLEYLLFFILLISIAWVLWYLGYVIYDTLAYFIDPNHSKRKKRGNVLSLYSTPFAVLIVSLTVMLAFGGSDMSFPEHVWSTLFVCILFLLVVMVSIGLVKHILEQMGTADSLLQVFIRLLFIATMAVFSDLIFGVIITAETALGTTNLTNFNSIINDVRSCFHEILLDEIRRVRVRRKWSFSKRRIWRRK